MVGNAVQAVVVRCVSVKRVFIEAVCTIVARSIVGTLYMYPEAGRIRLELVGKHLRDMLVINSYLVGLAVLVGRLICERDMRLRLHIHVM